MRARSFGLLDRAIPVIGQGTWLIEKTPDAAVAALRQGLDLGLTHVDTAEMYGSGEAERLVARAIADRRDEVFLVSKVMPQNASYRSALAACEASLRRLKTDRLDLYLLHWRGSVLLEETFRAFARLVADGKIRAWGVSNFDADDLEEAVSLVGEGQIACNQVLYHLGERAIEHRVLPWCAAHGVAVVAYSPFGSGRFPAGRSAGGRVLADVAARYQATPRQAALAWLLRHDGSFAIPKASSLAHVEENAGAGELVLSESDLAMIDLAFPLGKPPKTLPII
ncbi:MAG: aldo/keto reductase [Myxococcales bacterium]|nr:MAG: aldo/keto reductase [Myxococcales bacterium]